MCYFCFSPGLTKMYNQALLTVASSVREFKSLISDIRRIYIPNYLLCVSVHSLSYFLPTRDGKWKQEHSLASWMLFKHSPFITPPAEALCFISVFKKLSHPSPTDRCSLYFGCFSKVTTDPLFL